MIEQTVTVYTDNTFTIKQYLWLKRYANDEGMTVEEFLEELPRRFIKTTMPMTEE